MRYFFLFLALFIMHFIFANLAPAIIDAKNRVNSAMVGSVQDAQR